jgi:hypothetical protein
MTETPKNPAAQALGRLGGLARAKALSEDQRLAIAKKAGLMKSKRAKIQRLLSGMEDKEAI